jgi:Tat protein secretion system quality control protein TatD with DNase activity
MIDSHAHLNEIEDVDGGALRRAQGAGLTGDCGRGHRTWPPTGPILKVAWTAASPISVHPAVGYHPWSITPEGVEENLAFIREHLPRCVALGEVGLDYRAKPKKKLQQEVFGPPGPGGPGKSRSSSTPAFPSSGPTGW